MNAPAVEDEDDAAPHRAPDAQDETERVGPDDVAALDAEVQARTPSPGRERYRGDGREPIVSGRASLDGRLPARRPGAAADGLGHEARFVNEDDAPAPAPGVFYARPFLAPPALDFGLVAPRAPASGSSSSWRRAPARCGMSGISPRNAAIPSSSLERASTGPWRSRAPAGLSEAASRGGDGRAAKASASCRVGFRFQALLSGAQERLLPLRHSAFSRPQSFCDLASLQPLLEKLDGICLCAACRHFRQVLRAPVQRSW
jgi:hypothetical protein